MEVNSIFGQQFKKEPKNKRSGAFIRANTVLINKTPSFKI
jgi:hypothetical protein